MIFDIVQPCKVDLSKTYFKCIRSQNKSESDNAWELLDMLYLTFPRHSHVIVNFDGYENCVRIDKEPAPYL